MNPNEARERNVVRVLGQKRRIFGGWVRKDRVKYNEKELRGYVEVVRRNGKTTETTVFGQRRVEGYDWVWLAKRNSRTIRVEGYVAPVEIEKAA
jgi:hypothetical protein